MAGESPLRHRTRLRDVAAAFTLGAAGAVALLGARAFGHGNADPFDNGWPLYLQVGAFATALAVTMLTRCPAAAALGVFGGLVAYLFTAANAEYPASSAIALAVHGLFPALVGAVGGALVNFRRPRLSSETRHV